MAKSTDRSHEPAGRSSSIIAMHRSRASGSSFFTEPGENHGLITWRQSTWALPSRFWGIRYRWWSGSPRALTTLLVNTSERCSASRTSSYRVTIQKPYGVSFHTIGASSRTSLRLV